MGGNGVHIKLIKNSISVKFTVFGDSEMDSDTHNAVQKTPRVW
jgi:hypothetical protein